MTFEEILDQAIALLQRRGRLTYGALKRQFDLDDAFLQDLTEELIYGQQLAIDENGKVLVWSGATGSVAAPAPSAVLAPAVTPSPAPLSYTPPYLTEKILDARPRLEGERKQVTVLFADLKDSTELIRDLDPEAAQQLLDPALQRMMDVDLCQDTDLPVFFPRQAAALGVAYILSGRITDAVQFLTPAMEQSTAMAMVIHQVLCSLSVGEAKLLGGRLEEAHALAEEALALTRARQERCHQGYALRLLGEIAAQRTPPDVDQAEAYYQQALALAAALGMRPLQAHCHLGRGMLYRQLGRREPARAELAAAIDLYRAMDMAFWLPQAEAALAQMEGR
jgi:tetratricopeptide (TPR) repeat protein